MSEPQRAFPGSFLEVSPDMKTVKEEAQAATEEIRGPVKTEAESSNLEARAIAETTLQHPVLQLLLYPMSMLWVLRRHRVILS